MENRLEANENIDSFERQMQPMCPASLQKRLTNSTFFLTNLH